MGGCHSLLAMLCFAGASGCSRDRSLVGTWSYTVSGVSLANTLISYNSDGTWNESIRRSNGGILYTAKGTYKLAGGKLSKTVTEAIYSGGAGSTPNSTEIYTSQWKSNNTVELVGDGVITATLKRVR